MAFKNFEMTLVFSRVGDWLVKEGVNQKNYFTVTNIPNKHRFSPKKSKYMWWQLFFIRVYLPLLYIGLNCLQAAEPLWVDGFLLITKCSGVPGTGLIDLWRMKTWVGLKATYRLWNLDNWVGNQASLPEDHVDQSNLFENFQYILEWFR